MARTRKVRLNFPLRVKGKNREAGAVVEIDMADWRYLRHRKKSGKPIISEVRSRRQPDPDDEELEPEDEPEDEGNGDEPEDEGEDEETKPAPRKRPPRKRT